MRGGTVWLPLSVLFPFLLASISYFLETIPLEYPRDIHVLVKHTYSFNKLDEYIPVIETGYVLMTLSLASDTRLAPVLDVSRPLLGTISR